MENIGKHWFPVIRFTGNAIQIRIRKYNSHVPVSKASHQAHKQCHRGRCETPTWGTCKIESTIVMGMFNNKYFCVVEIGRRIPALVDNISVYRRVEPWVGGKHCQRHIGSLPGKNNFRLQWNAFENSNPQLLMIGPLPATTCSCLSEIFLSCL